MHSLTQTIAALSTPEITAKIDSLSAEYAPIVGIVQRAERVLKIPLAAAITNKQRDTIRGRNARINDRVKSLGALPDNRECFRCVMDWARGHDKKNAYVGACEYRDCRYF